MKTNCLSDSWNLHNWSDSSGGRSGVKKNVCWSDIAILKVTFNVNWKPLTLSAVGRLEKLNSTSRRDPELNPGPLHRKRACYCSATVARVVFTRCMVWCWVRTCWVWDIMFNTRTQLRIRTWSVSTFCMALSAGRSGGRSGVSSAGHNYHRVWNNLLKVTRRPNGATGIRASELQIQ